MATQKKGSGTPTFRKLKTIPEGIRVGRGMANIIWEQVKDLGSDRSVEISFDEEESTYIRTCLSFVNKKHGKTFSFRKVGEGKAVIFHNPDKVVRSKGRKKKGK